MHRTPKALLVLSPLIAALATVAALTGLLCKRGGRAFEFSTLRGETVTIQGHGLYRYDSISFAAQGLAQDVVTVAIGVPLLIVAMVLARQGRLRGQLLLAGTLAYFLYTYAAYAFGVAYNDLFLLYVALFSLGLFAFALALGAIDMGSLPACFSPHMPRRGICCFLYLIGAFLSLAWLGRIVPPLVTGRPPMGLESYSTLVIQTLDLGVIVPVSILAGSLLWRKRPWGYLLASIMLIKGFTMLLAIMAMIVNMLRAGVTVSLAECIMFPILTLADIGLTIALLAGVREPRATLK
jgi:hypothetical protein